MTHGTIGPLTPTTTIYLGRSVEMASECRSGLAHGSVSLDSFGSAPLIYSSSAMEEFQSLLRQETLLQKGLHRAHQEGQVLSRKVAEYANRTKLCCQRNHETCCAMAQLDHAGKALETLLKDSNRSIQRAAQQASEAAGEVQEFQYHQSRTLFFSWCSSPVLPSSRQYEILQARSNYLELKLFDLEEQHRHLSIQTLANQQQQKEKHTDWVRGQADLRETRRALQDLQKRRTSMLLEHVQLVGQSNKLSKAIASMCLHLSKRKQVIVELESKLAMDKLRFKLSKTRRLAARQIAERDALIQDLAANLKTCQDETRQAHQVAALQVQRMQDSFADLQAKNGLARAKYERVIRSLRRRCQALAEQVQDLHKEKATLAVEQSAKAASVCRLIDASLQGHAATLCAVSSSSAPRGPVVLSNFLLETTTTKDNEDDGTVATEAETVSTASSSSSSERTSPVSRERRRSLKAKLEGLVLKKQRIEAHLAL